LTKLGLFEAAEDLFEHLDETSSLHAECKIIGSTERLPENKEIMVYRIIQEMVNNTLKHAKANKMELSLSMVPGSLQLEYKDDGVGFDLNEKLGIDSIGLKSIQSRVNFLNGEMKIDSKPGDGVKYSIHIPI
jgi:two-component system NarL family sensor kinase